MARKSAKYYAKRQRCKDNMKNRVYSKKPEHLKIGCKKRADLQIWLDVDHTLLHSTQIYKNGCSKRNVAIRPHLKDFLVLCCTLAESVSLFSAVEIEVTEEKWRNVECPKSLPMFGRESLINESDVKDKTGYVSAQNEWNPFSKEVTIKEIPKFNPKNTLIIDDNADYYYSDQRNNVLQVARFNYTDGDSDDALVYIGELIRKLAPKRNRNIVDCIKELHAEQPVRFPAKRERTEQLFKNK